MGIDRKTPIEMTKQALFSGHLMAAGEAPAALPIAGVRQAIMDVCKVVTDLGGVLNEGPLKAKCLEISGTMTQTLAGLPKDDAPADSLKPEPIISGLLVTLASANGALIQLKAGMGDDLQASIERHVAGKIAKGELHTTADLQSKCDAARHETHACMMDHMKNFRARMQAMAAAKVPEPEEAVLLLKEEEFVPRFNTAKSRIALLEPHGVGPDRLQALCWKVDEDSFTTVLDNLKATKKEPPKEDKKNPFENSNPNPGAAGRSRYIGAGC